jgi:hypothetical protein
MEWPVHSLLWWQSLSRYSLSSQHYEYQGFAASGTEFQYKPVVQLQRDRQVLLS